jgi:hypothetical protein
MISKGTKYHLVWISYIKEAFQHDMPQDTRLKLLEGIARLQDNVLTPAVIALVEPMDAKGLELFDEIKKLGFKVVIEPGVGRRPDAFDEMYKKFDVFASLNPSLERAYSDACRPWGGDWERAS